MCPHARLGCSRTRPWVFSNRRACNHRDDVRGEPVVPAGVARGDGGVFRPPRGLCPRNAQRLQRQHRARHPRRSRPVPKLVRRTGAGRHPRARGHGHRVHRRDGRRTRPGNGTPLRFQHRVGAPCRGPLRHARGPTRQTRRAAHAPHPRSSSEAGVWPHLAIARAPACRQRRPPDRRAQPRAARGRLRRHAAPLRTFGGPGRRSCPGPPRQRDPARASRQDGCGRAFRHGCTSPATRRRS